MFQKKRKLKFKERHCLDKMDYKVKRELRRLNSKQVEEDIKRYLKSPYEFYGIRIPELKTMGKKFHDSHSLKEFYPIFNNLWKSNYHDKMSLAIYSLQLYKEEFDLTTWKFIKNKLKDMKTIDIIDNVGINIIGEILLKYPYIKREILKMSKSKNPLIRRLAIVSTLTLINKKETDLSFKLAESYLNDKSLYVQKATGWILNECSKKKQEKTKKFILKNKLNPVIFNYATEKMKELRKLKKIKKLKKDKKGIISWLKNN